MIKAFSCLLIYCSVFFAPFRLIAEQPLPQFAVGDEIKSPKGDLIIEYYGLRTLPDDGTHHIISPREIWLSDAKNRSHRELLLKYERSAEVFVSPDESCLIVNDNSASGLAEIRLFRRKHDLAYTEDKSVDINELAWTAARRQTRLALKELDHSYVSAIRWLDNSHLRIGLGGDGPHDYIEGWRGIYDLNTHKIEPRDYDDAGLTKNL